MPRLCVHTNTRAQTTGAICRLFLFACLSSTSIPSSLPQQVLLSSWAVSSSSVCPLLPLPVFHALSSFSCSSLQYTVPRGDSSKSNCLSISHQYTASRGSCPLKTMKVGLSAEPGIRFNYINKEFGSEKNNDNKNKQQKKKKTLRQSALLRFDVKPLHMTALKMHVKKPRACRYLDIQAVSALGLMRAHFWRLGDFSSLKGNFVMDFY